ncbi:MAG: hypothetical protein CDV28_10750 [Candidatus Electronema aureum]|uniref:Fic/DOC family N-terminal n=1 Tax=Candidatus Electronema aureum TaxID=2005002 RepID=A0A521G362_9BACT|nr:MAG: hypothetical protein CDV28_10750 [Candidatus Electronema aureum]
MPALFTHFDLKIPEPTFASPLTDLIIELDHLRKKQIGGTTPPRIFFQLKKIFHLLESIGSARIEGNNTTIAEYVEHKIQPEANGRGSESITEIENAEAAMNFIDQVIDENAVIDKSIIFELHKRTVNGLSA